jgi:hypothetical protein
MRHALLEAGARFARRGPLPDHERVLFLRRSELEQALRGSPALDLGPTSAARESEYRQQHLVDPPQMIEIAACQNRPKRYQYETRRPCTSQRGFGVGMVPGGAM